MFLNEDTNILCYTHISMIKERELYWIQLYAIVGMK